MASDTLSRLSFVRWDEPRPEPDLRASRVGWLGFQRHEFQRKWRGLTPEQLATWSVPPVELSVIGLVRHMHQMEHAYLSWGLGGGDRVEALADRLEEYAAGALAPSADR